ncbi:MAG TPA: hemolysin family protein [Ktedonobacterales bacterium]|jgi:CBS domain containing-hemolysin-like protein
MDSSPWPGPLAALATANLAAPSVHGFTATDWALLIALIVVLVIAGLASASETALTSINRIRLHTLAEGGNRRAVLISRLVKEPNTFLATILIVNSVALIVASTMATVIAIDVLTSWGEVISTVLISLVVLIFCEVTPKTAAVQAPERWALALAPLVYGASVILRWPIAGLTVVTSLLVRIFGGEPPHRGPFVTAEELRRLADVAEEEGVLEEEKNEMIHNVFELGDTTVREVMVPRIDMVTVEADDSVNEAVGVFLQGGLSRIPVYSESIDNILGVLYAKDLLRVLAQDQHPDSVRGLVRPAYFIPETKRADDLLHELQLHHVHMAIVVDEYGGVAGVVTIEDLVEEIIGPIQDEYDREETLFERVSENEYIVDAKIPIDEFNELLDAKLLDEDYDTLGGFVYTQLDKIPSVGDVATFDGLTFTVLGTRGLRVTKVKVVRGPTGPDAGTAAGAGSAVGGGVPAAPDAARPSTAPDTLAPDTVDGGDVGNEEPEMANRAANPTGIDMADIGEAKTSARAEQGAAPVDGGPVSSAGAGNDARAKDAPAAPPAAASAPPSPPGRGEPPSARGPITLPPATNDDLTLPRAAADMRLPRLRHPAGRHVSGHHGRNMQQGRHH